MVVSRNGSSGRSNWVDGLVVVVMVTEVVVFLRSRYLGEAPPPLFRHTRPTWSIMYVESKKNVLSVTDASNVMLLNRLSICIS